MQTEIYTTVTFAQVLTLKTGMGRGLTRNTAWGMLCAFGWTYR